MGQIEICEGRIMRRCFGALLYLLSSLAAGIFLALILPTCWLLLVLAILLCLIGWILFKY